MPALATAATAATSSDICDEVLKGERAAREMARIAYEVGSAKRLASVAQYREWRAEARDKLHRLRNVDLVAADAEMEGLESSLLDARISMAKNWLEAVDGVLAAESPLVEVVGNGAMSLDDLASFVVSLCWLSAEASAGNIADGRCLPLDRASLDLGILWNYSSVDGGDALPSFDRLNGGTETALVDLADKILLRLEGKDAENDRAVRNASQKRKSKNPPPYYDSSDDPYGDDWADHPDYVDDDDYVGDENYQSREEDAIEPQAKGEDDAKEETAAPMI